MACERFGDVQAPPVLLVMGLGAQMLSWHEGFCARLVARGLQAADAVGLLDALGLDSAHIVGVIIERRVKLQIHRTVRTRR